jgi:hypothetical protein
VFELFASNFRLLPSGQAGGDTWNDPCLVSLTGYEELAAEFAGCSFENGLYRFHDARTGPRGERWIAGAFPEFASCACPFGYDWLDRQFAVDAGRKERDEPLVLVLEPGTGEALEVPFSSSSFYENLAEPGSRHWRRGSSLAG